MTYIRLSGYDPSALPIPLIPLAIGALLGSTGKKEKKDYQAVKGRKRKDGTTGKAYIRKKAKKKSDSWFSSGDATAVPRLG